MRTYAGFDMILILVLAAIVAATLLMHELGHFLAFRLFGKKPSIRLQGFVFFIGENCITELTNLQAAMAAAAGIILGIFPFVAFYHILPQPINMLFPLLYICGSWFDFEIIWKGVTNPCNQYIG